MERNTPFREGARPLGDRRCFVCVRERHANGLVEFLFAVGDPDLSVELVMPEAAFDDFCARNRVERVAHMTPSTPEDAPDFAWDLHRATHDRFR